MTRTIAPFIALLSATAILLIGNGLLGTLVPIRAGIDGFDTPTVGIFGSVYFAGFLLGCIGTPYVVRRAGHIRSFAALCAAASAAPLIHALFNDAWAWSAMRGLTGFCFAGLYMVIESWLNEQASNETRGRLFAIYLVVNLLSVTAGQLLLNLSDPAAFGLFALCSILTSLALVPVALTTSVQPAPIQTVSINLKRLYALSPVGLMGSFVIGLTNGPFWTLGPLFASESGLNTRDISFFMTAAIVGGALAQFPIGRYSDRLDRRIVIMLLCIGAVLGDTALFYAGGVGSMEALLGAGFAFGVFSLTLYSVVVAHMNDHAQEESFVSVSSGLLLVYAAGAILGPLAASLVAQRFGMSAIFLFVAAIHIVYALFTLARIRSRAALSEEQRGEFVAVPFPQTQAAGPELDPRFDEDASHAAEGEVLEGASVQQGVAVSSEDFEMEQASAGPEERPGTTTGPSPDKPS
ncbi:MFS family permease [Parvibaculum indicum]|uniref:MFS transporter n=1 Tax=Parvibaculum indicum TaxID=562969 RepID=UPI00142433DC|nr:MFS transporter [Parvibaculum indicum]NIJ42674.1 MFS family permease [Parvibaculum indicum]